MCTVVGMDRTPHVVATLAVILWASACSVIAWASPVGALLFLAGSFAGPSMLEAVALAHRAADVAAGGEAGPQYPVVVGWVNPDDCLDPREALRYVVR